MVLKLKYIFTIAIVVFFTTIYSQNKIIYTDKYDVNYISSTNTNITKLFIASDLFQFLALEEIYETGNFINSFLTNEKIIFNQNIGFLNDNTFVIEIENSNIQNCKQIAQSWHEQYDIEFKEKLQIWVNALNEDSLTSSSNDLVFRSLINSEKARFFNHGNSVNTITVSFQIPNVLTANDFIKVSKHYNTKRYKSKETELMANEIIFNDDVAINNLKFTFPSMGRHTFLKNCIAMTMIERLYKKDLKFNLAYYVNQVVASFTVPNRLNNIDSLHYHFDKISLTENQFQSLKNDAINKIIAISQDNFHYYSYYDIEKLKVLKTHFDLKDFYKQIDILNDKRFFIIEINPESNILFNEITLINTHATLFNKAVLCKKNSVNFLNENDTILINQLKVFLKINPSYNISIDGLARKSEYLFVEKEYKEKLLHKYENLGYTISKRKKLALFRSLSVFDKLYHAGIDYRRIKCSGLNNKTPSIKFNVYVND